jgi:hypothetical protein
METWRHGKLKPWRLSLIRLPFAHRANGSLSFVRLLTEETSRSYPFANPLNGLIGLNGLLHLCKSVMILEKSTIHWTLPCGSFLAYRKKHVWLRKPEIICFSVVSRWSDVYVLSSGERALPIVFIWMNDREAHCNVYVPVGNYRVYIVVWRISFSFKEV